MDIDWNAEVVDQIDTHWRERLRPRERFGSPPTTYSTFEFPGTAQEAPNLYLHKR